MNTLLERGRRGKPLSDLDILDMHGHLGRYAFAIPDLSPTVLVRSMDRLGVKLIVVSTLQCMTARVREGNDAVLAAMRAHPGRILGYVSLYPSSPDDVRDEAERCLAAGFTGLKVHNSNGFPYTHSAYLPAYAIAHERRLPILFHTWGEPQVLQEVSEVARCYPQSVVLAAHSGSANEAGYLQLVREHPNICLELAFSRSPFGLVERLVAGAGAERVVWGSDAFFFSQSQQIGKVLGARISEEEKLLILGGNARRILQEAKIVAMTGSGTPLNP